MFHKVTKLHFVGIGGIGMSGIAELLHNLGYTVSGSDSNQSDITDHLINIGLRIVIGHNKNNLLDCEVVVYSAAVPPTNPELVEARKRNIPIIPRAEMLNELMRLKTGIAISGTHGKTTTTSIVAELLAAGGLDPTYVIGGKLNSINSNAKLGKGKYLVFEACEAFGSFLYFSPIIMVLLNIDEDHMEYYHSMDALRDAFLDFLNKIPFYGMAIVNNDDENVRRVVTKTTKRIVTFGLEHESDYFAKNIKFTGISSEFDVYYKENILGHFKIELPGKHNVSNALSAIAVANELEVSLDDIKNSLQKFRNADRRFQVLGRRQGITVVDDYAHHPAEITATLEAANNNEEFQRVIAVFQPHLYSRTLALYEDFAEALALADEVLLTPIYPAREKPIPGASSSLICDVLQTKLGKGCVLLDEREQTLQYLNSNCRKGDAVIFMGAGNIWQYAKTFLECMDE